MYSTGQILGRGGVVQAHSFAGIYRHVDLSLLFLLLALLGWFGLGGG